VSTASSFYGGLRHAREEQGDRGEAREAATMDSWEALPRDLIA